MHFCRDSSQIGALQIGDLTNTYLLGMINNCLIAHANTVELAVQIMQMINRVQFYANTSLSSHILCC